MGWGKKALENDELEGRQGLGERAVHRIKEFIRLQQGASMRGHCSRWRGWQGGWQNQGWGRRADGNQGCLQDKTAEEHRWGWGHQAAAPGCTGGNGQLKEGTAVSVERAGRPGQLACPEDTLEQLCRFPRAIWLRRTYLAHQLTVLSARLPQLPLSLPAKPPSATLQPP